MAQPIRYQSQFVPTNFGTLGNILGMYHQDMMAKDKRFDTSMAMANQTLSELYGMQTFDQEGLQEQVDALSQKIQQAVDKRGGDYGAAAKEIAGIISKEASNPFYKLNQRKVEQIGKLEDALARNPNLYVLNDPRQQGLTKGMSPEDIGYQVVDPANIQAMIKSVYGKLGDQIHQGDIEDTNKPGWLKSVITKGQTPEQVQAMLEDPNVRQTILNKMPQLAQFMGDEKNSQWFNTQLEEGLRGLVGGSETQYLRDYAAEQAAKNAMSGYIPIAKGANMGIKNDRPFNSAQELNELPENDPRYLIGQKVKQKAFDKLSTEDKNTVANMGGIDNVTELAEVAPALPSVKSGLAKVVNDVGLLLKTIGAVGAGLSNMAPGAIGAGVSNMVPAFQLWDKLKDVQSPLDDYLQRKKEVTEKYGLNDMPRSKRRQVLHDAIRLNARVTANINQDIQDNYGDILGDFYTQDFLTGNSKVDAHTSAIYKNLNERVKAIPFDQFRFLGTNSDINYNKQDKLRKKDNEEYMYSTEAGHYRILEAHVDEDLGPVYLLETDRKKGGSDYSLVTLDNPQYNKQILQAYGSANIPKYLDKDGNVVASDLSSDYESFLRNQEVKNRFKGDLKNLPEFDKFKGGTIEDYLTFLADNPNIPYDDKVAATLFIKTTHVPITTQLKAHGE